MELLQTPEQREVMDRVTAFMSLLEGHAEHVMDAVGPEVVPTVQTIRDRFEERRRDHGNPLERLLRRLLGLDLKAKQYAEGSAFVRHAVDAVGMAAFNRVWESPGTLPTREEIRDPQLLGRPGRRGLTVPGPRRPPRRSGSPYAGACRATTQPVAAAVSGGADSLALAAALAFERPGADALVVDHGLQEGSADVAARAAGQCAALGLVPRVLTHAAPPARGEAAARDGRYALLGTWVDERRGVVLLGHTRDDQAEQVLLGLVRGSGTRAAAGMPPVRGAYRRPLLDLPRTTTVQACAEAGLEPWTDPHNSDPAYLRVVVRRLLDGLDVTDGLARSARLLREDADALDALAVATGDVERPGRSPGRPAIAGPSRPGRSSSAAARSPARTSTPCALSSRTGTARGRSDCPGEGRCAGPAGG